MSGREVIKDSSSSVEVPWWKKSWRLVRWAKKEVILINDGVSASNRREGVA
jgi:hypothetical protein